MEEHREIHENVQDSGSERCPACGRDNLSGAEKCSECGQRLLPASQIPSRISMGVSFRQLQQDDAAPETIPPPDTSPVGQSEDVPEQPPMDEPSATSQMGNQANGPRHIDETDFRYYFAPSYPGIILQPAGFIRRAAALAADWIMVNLLAMLVMYIGGWGTQLNELNQLIYSQGLSSLSSSALPASIATTASILAMVELGLAIGLYAIFSAYGGATPGMYLVGIQICRLDGADVGLISAITRAVILWLFIFLTAGFYLIVAGITMLIDPKGRSVHDYLCGTNVFLK